MVMDRSSSRITPIRAAGGSAVVMRTGESSGTGSTAVTGAPLSDDAFQRVRMRSEGNAYYAEELVESGADAVTLPG